MTPVMVGAPPARPEPPLRRRWQSWDARLGEPGPWHVRRDLPDRSKVVAWRQASGGPGLGDHNLEDLCYLTDVARDTLRQYWTPTFVVVTEGEKTADAVAATGLPAIATVCGAAGTPGTAVVSLLAPWPIALAPDNDDVGRGHMDRLGRLLELAGVPSLSIVRPPAGALPGWDLADCPPEMVRELVAAAIDRPIGPVAP